MSYFRYIASVYSSALPQLNRTLRSSSVPRQVTAPLDTSRYARSASVPPATRFSGRHAASPFRDQHRALSVPPRSQARTTSDYSHYTDFDCKVVDYMGRLGRQDSLREFISQSRQQQLTRQYPAESYRSNYNYYDCDKYSGDYLYPVRQDVLGNWKHYSLSRDTLRERNERATSPLVARELTRYFGTQKRTDYAGSVSQGSNNDFRFYNYRRVPYMGGSDNFKYMQHKPFRKNSSANGAGSGSGGRSRNGSGGRSFV